MSELLAFIALVLSITTFLLAIYTHIKLNRRNKSKDKEQTWYDHHTPEEQSELLKNLSKDNTYTQKEED